MLSRIEEKELEPVAYIGDGEGDGLIRADGHDRFLPFVTEPLRRRNAYCVTIAHTMYQNRTFKPRPQY